MDSNARESSDTKAEFRKPSNDAANRKYRRRSPVGGSSSSSDGSPHRRRSSSPVPSNKDISKASDDKRKRDYERNESRRGDESFKHSDQHSSRRRDRDVDDYDRGYSKSSYRSVRDSRDSNTLNYSRSDKEHRPRDYVNDVDTYSSAKSDRSGHRSRDKDSYDRNGSGRSHAAMEEKDRDRERDRQREDRADRYGKTDNRKSSRDNRSDRSPAYEESRCLRNDSYARKDSSAHHLKEGPWRDAKELGSERLADDEKRRNDDHRSFKEQGNRDKKAHSDDMSMNGENSIAKKPKTVESTGPGTDGTSDKDSVKDSDIDAAKIAAMKAAELVNKNLVGSGYMSTDQKKKLLWGNKKSTPTVESPHRWDSTMFGDRERQEKFNKLMSLRLHWWPIVGREGGGKGGEQARQPRCGKATRTASDGTGETIHSRTASERWSDCWTWSLKSFFRYSHTCVEVFLGILIMYCMIRLLCTTMNVGHVVVLGSLNLIGKDIRLSMTIIIFQIFCICWQRIVLRVQSIGL